MIDFMLGVALIALFVTPLLLMLKMMIEEAPGVLIFAIIISIIIYLVLERFY